MYSSKMGKNISPATSDIFPVHTLAYAAFQMWSLSPSTIIERMQKGCNMGGRLLNLGVLYTVLCRFLYSVHNPKDSLNVTLCLESSERIHTESKEHTMGKIYSGRYTTVISRCF